MPEPEEAAGDAQQEQPRVEFPPLEFSVGIHPDQPAVFLSIATQFGPMTYPMEIAVARKLGQGLREASGKAEEAKARRAMGLVAAEKKLQLPGQDF